MKAAEEAQLPKIEEEKRIAEEERKKREEEDQRQVAITLAKYQKNVERAEEEKREAERMEFKKREDEVIVLRKAKVAREAKARVKKEVVAVTRLESKKAKGSKKRG